MERCLTRLEVVVPAQPAAVRRVHVEVDVVLLQAGYGVGDALLVSVGGLRAEGDARVGDEVAEGVGLEDDGKGQVRGGGELGRVGRDELGLVEGEPAVGAAQLARRLARAAVAVRQVVQHQPDDLVDAGGRLGRARRRDRRVDVGQAGAVRDPDCAG